MSHELPDSTDRFRRAGAAFEQLCRTMHTLRAPGGCPWDREQTLASLKPYLIEEAYETLEAMESGDAREHCEELGDLLLQVVFQSEIAQETALFDTAAVAHAINDKLVRRHPHVFAGARANDAAGALQNWEAIKATERPKSKGRLDGIPRALPGLTRAMRTGEKAAAVGFDWPDAAGSKAKVDEEMRELEEALAAPGSTSNSSSIKEEMGDLLFALVNLCRHLRLDPEEALRGTIEKFQQRFGHLERSIGASGRSMESASLDELNELWDDAKARERRQ